MLLDRSFTLVVSDEQQHFVRRNTCPLCQRFILYTTTYEPGGRVRRIRNPKDAASLAECPKCHGRWFYFKQPVDIEFIDGERWADEVYEKEVVLDNRQGTSPLTRKQTVTEEWTQSYEVEKEQTHSQGTKLTVGIQKGPNLAVTAEQAVKERYSISEQKSHVYTEELAFDVPPGIRRTVVMTFKQIWHAGVIRFSIPDADNAGGSNATAEFEVPFKVVVDVTMDLTQTDSSD